MQHTKVLNTYHISVWKKRKQNRKTLSGMLLQRKRFMISGIMDDGKDTSSVYIYMCSEVGMLIMRDTKAVCTAAVCTEWCFLCSRGCHGKFEVSSLFCCYRCLV